MSWSWHSEPMGEWGLGMRKKGNKVDGQAHTLRNCRRSFRVSRPGAAGLRPPTGTDRHRAAMVTE